MRNKRLRTGRWRNDMTRVVARELAVHLIYELDFSKEGAEALLKEALTPERFAKLASEEELYSEFPDDKQMNYICELVTGVERHRTELDECIGRYAIGWSVRRIPRVAAAILRTAMYEVRYCPDVPNNAAISAAVELAKSYEDEKVVSFVNGILGSFSRDEAAQ
jgi:N utilization substance protein B